MTANPSDRFAPLFAALDKHLPDAARLRRELHRYPDLSGAEQPTLRRLLRELPTGAEVETVGETAALVRLGPAGPAVAVRAEMDALPIREETGADFAATNGAMHACGHDIHMAAFIALSATLAERDDLPLALVGLLQPREETFPSGALDLIEEPRLPGHDIRAVIGVHVQPAMRSKALAASVGTVNAASDEFYVTFTGTPAHGAYPHLSHDPVLAASAFVVSVQQVAARNTDPMQAVVVSVGSIHGGEAPNAIPGEVRLCGTVRTATTEQQTFVHERIRQIATGIAAVHGCLAEVRFVLGDPPMINDAALAETTTALLRGQGIDAGGEFRSCGADDFAFYGRLAPSLMIFAGTDGGPGQGLHSPSFLPDEDTLRRVAQGMLAGYLAAAEVVRSGAVLDLATLPSLSAASRPTVHHPRPQPTRSAR